MTTKTPIQGTFIDRFKRLFVVDERADTLPATNLKNPLNWFTDLFAPKSKSGVNVNAKTSLSISAVHAAVRVLSDAVGSLSKECYKRDGESILPDYEHPHYDIINLAPNAVHTSFTLWSSVTTQLALNGNAYLIPRYYKGGELSHLEFVESSKVDLYVNEDKRKTNLRYFYVVRGTEIKFTDEICHFRLSSLDGYAGLDTISTHKDILGNVIAASEFEGSFFSNMAVLSGFIEHPGSLKPEQREDIRKEWKKKYSGTDNAGNVAILYGGTKYTPIASTPKDSMLEELKRFSVEEIARIFRIPLHMLGHLDKMSFNNVEQMSHDFVVHTLRPIVKMIEQELNKKLYPRKDRRKRFIRFNIDSLLRGDTATRAEFYAKMRAINAMSPNEVRALENMNPYEGGDHYDNPNTTSKTKTDGEEDV